MHYLNDIPFKMAGECPAYDTNIFVIQHKSDILSVGNGNKTTIQYYHYSFLERHVAIVLLS